MHTDNDFLVRLLADTADDATRLVYADWLEEQGDPVSAAKAEFLRVTVQLAAAPTRKKKKAHRKRLQQLAAELDTDWLAVVSRLAIENCHRKRKEESLRSRAIGLPQFRYLCDRRWEDLRPTEDRAERFCDACRKTVHYCDTITVAREHAAAGHCIAVDLGVIRRDREPRLLVLGMPNPEWLRREAERMRQDAVSAERERRKRGKVEGGEA